MKYKFFIALIFILFSFKLFSQHEADFWYFGDYAGLDFSSGNPEPLTDGQLQNYEGCAAISDSTGNLLFYTNGVTVWNKEHQIMSNGENLMGNASSTQSAIIVPVPEYEHELYIFTTDVLVDDEKKYFDTNGLRYSTVNMNNENGNGEILYKNILLLDSTLEKITAIKHHNNKDYWIIAHEYGNDKYYSYLLNKNGLNPPVISNVGTYFENDQRLAIGYMKTSPNGSKIVTSILRASKWEIFDFDNQTGILSNPIEITRPVVNLAYSCEFSPDNSKLYISSLDTLFQVDMNAGTQTDIQNSLSQIAVFDSPIGAIQNANNGKIYITADTLNYLSVINYPDSLPISCGFEKNTIYLDGKKSRLGLPNFIQSYFKKKIFNYERRCSNDSTHFIINDVSEIDSVFWNFGDINSGSLNTSKEISPFHIYSELGTYNVNLTIWYNNNATNYYENIKIISLPEVNLGTDTTFCISNNYKLNAYSPHLSYLWNDNSTDSVLEINTSNKYWVEVQNIYTKCKNSDTINIVFSKIPEINLGNDTSFCENSTFLIDAFHYNYTYIWQDNSTNSYFETDTTGTFYVKVANIDNCTNYDTITLSHKYLPRFNFVKDTAICENSTYFLEPILSGDTEFLWQDGTSDTSFPISNEGSYKLITENVCGTWQDSINVTTRYCGEIYIPNIFTPTNDGINELFKIKGIDEDIWELSIYSRWGEKVFHSSDYQNNWNGKGLSPAVYYYVLSNAKLEKQYKGTVRIVRAK